MVGNARVSVLVACKNEEANVERCIREILRVLPDAEVLILHGGTDRTYEIAADIARGHPNVRPLRNPNDRGKGHALKLGIASATGSVMCQFDCDLQFFADDLPALLDPVQRGERDLVLGSRFLGSSDRSGYRAMPLRDFGNWLISAYVSALIGRRVTDVTAGVKAWTREAIRRIDFRDDRYSYEAEMVVRAGSLGLRIGEVPVRYANRTAGESMHRNSFALGRAGLTIMLKAFAARLRRR